MFKISDIAVCLEKAAPLSAQEDYDNAGLIIGNPRSEVRAALVCLDCTEAVVREAVRDGCGLIISHHPLIFRGIKRLNGATDAERAVLRAVRNDIAVYAMHTNLDNMPSGVNAGLCRRLGVLGPVVLLPRAGQKGQGAGMIGTLRVPVDEKSFLKHIKSCLQSEFVRHSPLEGRPVRRVAVCGGSGSFLLENAVAAGADAYVTSDVGYHRFFDAAGRILLVDAGHYETECHTPDMIKAILKKKFPKFAVRLTSLNTNPVNYL